MFSSAYRYAVLTASHLVIAYLSTQSYQLVADSAVPFLRAERSVACVQHDFSILLPFAFVCQVLSHIRVGSGASYITGWVSAFTCFNKDGKFLGKEKAKDGEFPMVGENRICHNVVSCPVKIDNNGHIHDGTIFSGQTVCEAERAGETGHPTVRPRNDWCLAVAMKEE